MVSWDDLEAAGHNLTHCGMVQAGTQLYYCENCGAVMLTRFEGIQVWHVPRGSKSTQEECHYPETEEPPATLHMGLAGRRIISRPTFKLKLEALIAEDWERLKEI